VLTSPASQSETRTLQLEGIEILEAFADVRDDAEVQGSIGTRAINYWYADGRFFNRWSNGENTGEVTGTWRLEGNLRCVTIRTGLPKRINRETCGPVFSAQLHQVGAVTIGLFRDIKSDPQVLCGWETLARFLNV
jgi:hypothetical protein